MMMWPWVWRRHFAAERDRRLTAEGMYQAAERLRVDAGQRLGASEVARQQQFEAHEREIADLRMRLSEAESERKTLMDRIVQLSGQPAIYQRPAVAEPAAAAASQLTPRTRTTFEDVHSAVRDAMKDGTFDYQRRPN
jgi:hypothetical protein